VNEISIGALLLAVTLLIALAGFFAGSETALMALNRYRLKHLVKLNHRGAKRAAVLLERPDRLIGLILLGNTFVELLSASLATLVGVRILGDELGAIVSPVVLTLAVLIFGEVAPKTLAATHPEKVAFPASLVLQPLLTALYPLVWIVNAVANGILSIIGIRQDSSETMTLSREELRTVVQEASAMIPQRHQQMLMSILDLEKVTVDDIMIPRSEIMGVDLEGDLRSERLREQLSNTRVTRLPVYRSNIDNMVGILHARQIARLLFKADEILPDDIERALSEPYFVPAGTPLHVQLANFQRHKKRMGLVVDEYGDILGLVTLEDLLEEIVGEFTQELQPFGREVIAQPDGSYLVDGAAYLRELNRSMHWKLPVSGPKTLNGLILETMPEPGTTLRIPNYVLEIVQTSDNAVKTVRVIPLEGLRPAVS
jgi:Mg2+/Co2+ transporter CorB